LASPLVISFQKYYEESIIIVSLCSCFGVADVGVGCSSRTGRGQFYAAASIIPGSVADAYKTAKRKLNEVSLRPVILYNPVSGSGNEAFTPGIGLAFRF
jgi:hypothetical protein